MAWPTRSMAKMRRASSAQQIRPLDSTRVDFAMPAADQRQGDLRVDAQIVNAKGTALTAPSHGGRPFACNQRQPRQVGCRQAATTADVRSAWIRSSTCAKAPAPALPSWARSSPGENYKVTGKTDAGDWWQLDFGDRKGWVIGQLVSNTVG